MPWFSRPSSRGDASSITASIDSPNGHSLISKLSSRTFGDAEKRARDGAVNEFKVETLNASFDLVTPRDAYSGQVVLNTKMLCEDAEIWITFGGYTRVEGKLMRFVETEKLLRKTKAIQPGTRETHIFALQFPPTNLPPTCDKPWVHYELVSELRVNTEGNQMVIKSKAHELLFIPLLDPVLLERPTTPGSPAQRNTVLVTQEELADGSAPTPDHRQGGGLLQRVTSLRKATTNNFSPNSPKRTETIRGLTKRQLTLHESTSNSPLLDLKLSVSESEFRPGNILSVSYRLAVSQTQALPKSLTLAIVSHQYLSQSPTLTPLSPTEITTKILQSKTLPPQPSTTATIALPSEPDFLKRSPFLPTCSLPFGPCSLITPSPTTSQTALNKGKAAIRIPTITNSLRFVCTHAVTLTAHFKGESDYTIEVPVAIGNQKARKLKAPEFVVSFHDGSDGGSSSAGRAGGFVTPGGGMEEREEGWDGRGQFPDLEAGGRPYWRVDGGEVWEE